MSGVQLQRIHFKGFEVLSDKYNIAAAVVVPAGCRTLATSGHVGLNENGELAETTEEQINLTFENVEKAILAAAPQLTKAKAWKSVYQITTYHKGGLSPKVVEAMFGTAERTLGDHAPAWTAVGVEDLYFGNFEMAVFAAIP